MLFSEFIISPIMWLDSYKLSHPRQYHPDIAHIFSNWTPRSSRVSGQDYVIVPPVGLVLNLIFDRFQRDFFDLDRATVLNDFITDYTNFSGNPPHEDDINRVGQLHDLGYLPMIFYHLPEGSKCNIRVPMFRAVNTHPDFAWLTNSLETTISANVWQMITSATTASRFYKRFHDAAVKSSDSMFMVPFQGHDFSYRGQTSDESAILSGIGHLTYFTGTDTVPSVCILNDYQRKFVRDPQEVFIGGSVPATEHSVASTYGDDRVYIKRALELYPEGIVSVVADTYDFWHFVTVLLAEEKDTIINGKTKFVVRPDSSPKTPVEVIIGDEEAEPGSPEYKGLAECLWDIFGGTVNSKGYKELHPNIGMIYGDSIIDEYQERILEGLMKKGFASTNVVLGLGSYLYQYTTRDTYGQAFKTTGCVFNGEFKPVFKDPKTDTSGKKSARGFTSVVNGELVQYETLTQEQLQSIFEGTWEDDMVVFKHNDLECFSKIRQRALSSIGINS